MGTILNTDQVDLATVIFVDARSGAPGRAAFKAGHFPGARYGDLETDLSHVPDNALNGGRHPLPGLSNWTTTLGAWGIGPEDQVVVYDDQGGVNAAARAWWMLRAVGHEKVSVLNGGFQAGVTAGWPLETSPSPPKRKPPYPAEKWALPTVTLDDVKTARSEPGRLLIDVRAAERFSGEVEPIDPIGGHIPGAVNIPLSGNLDANGFFRDPKTLRNMYELSLKGRVGSNVIAQCGSGVTACHTVLAMEHAGISGAALYVGSWSEWCLSGEPREPSVL